MRRRSRLVEAATALAILAPAFLELWIRDQYFGIGSESKAFLLCASATLAIVSAAVWVALGPARPAHRPLGRAMTWLAVAITVHVLLSATLASWLGSANTVTDAVIAVAALAAFAGSLALAAPAWNRLARSLAVLGLVFVASQGLVGPALAPSISWPAAAAAPARPGEPAAITVFLLLDELNANRAQPIADAFARAGLKTESKRIVAVADGTSKVVPALFTGTALDLPKPCSPTAICGARRVLDFARITASRPDLDIVGFFHPYCAIQGLRSCSRSEVPSALADAGVWRCGLWRRTGWPAQTRIADCDRAYGAGWAAMTTDVIAALWRAPVWREGGVLFAHVPLPHPPGHAGPAGSLDADYRANVQEAAGLVATMADRARASGRRFRFIVFSDHPLRQKVWCTSYPPYVLRGCAPTPALEDDRVPLIVAGGSLPDTSAIVTNAQVFDLLGSWVGPF